MNKSNAALYEYIKELQATLETCLSVGCEKKRCCNKFKQNLCRGVRFANCQECVDYADYTVKQECETTCSWSDDLTDEERMNCQKMCDAMANESVADCYQQGLCCGVACLPPTTPCNNLVGECMSQEQACESLCDDTTPGYFSCLTDCRLDRSQCVRGTYMSEQCCPDVCPQPPEPQEPPCRCRQMQQPYRQLYREPYREPSYSQPSRDWGRRGQQYHQTAPSRWGLSRR
jgi:hypothetical protein